MMPQKVPPTIENKDHSRVHIPLHSLLSECKSPWKGIKLVLQVPCPGVGIKIMSCQHTAASATVDPKCPHQCQGRAQLEA